MSVTSVVEERLCQELLTQEEGVLLAQVLSPFFQKHSLIRNTHFITGA